jgi:hypothetical protein
MPVMIARFAMRVESYSKGMFFVIVDNYCPDDRVEIGALFRCVFGAASADASAAR